MARGLAVSDTAAPERDHSGLASDPTESLALGAGLFGAEGGGLLRADRLDRPLGRGAARCLGDRPHGVGTEVDTGTDLLRDPSRHDFSPSLGHALNPRRIHRRRLAEWHRMSLLGLRARRGSGSLG